MALRLALMIERQDAAAIDLLARDVVPGCR
jgi:hypothetical protein